MVFVSFQTLEIAFQTTTIIRRFLVSSTFQISSIFFRVPANSAVPFQFSFKFQPFINVSRFQTPTVSRPKLSSRISFSSRFQLSVGTSLSSRAQLFLSLKPVTLFQDPILFQVSFGCQTSTLFLPSAVLQTPPKSLSGLKMSSRTPPSSRSQPSFQVPTLVQTSNIFQAPVPFQASTVFQTSVSFQDPPSSLPDFKYLPDPPLLHPPSLTTLLQALTISQLLRPNAIDSATLDCDNNNPIGVFPFLGFYL